ncbi:hypothetical protein NQ314_004311 [Rhamnusium bicolor]|uniref:C2 domain-containing protein n=1 Tax=Rhamnusium bicolor TaxID=1586634 RepID=A0AAV8ZJS1_9CUCU|nr:hypothetical protein NQ314_004311 [Rhamnusium bicolor]
MIKLPIVGGIQIFFLNTPDINFELEGISAIPGFSWSSQIKLQKRFSKSVEAAELKSLEPEGVLRVHVFEARDLEKKDVTGKSDPYVILNVGAQECKTQVIKRELNPKWDYWCEFIILDHLAQHLQFKMFDQDELNEDDFMGSGIIEIQSASQETKQLKVADISTALLTVYIDSAQNLPKVKSYKKPEPYVILTVGKKQQKTRVKKHTTDPVWEQGFSLLVSNPENDSLIISIVDKHTDVKIDHLVYNIRDLFDMPDLQISKKRVSTVYSWKNYSFSTIASKYTLILSNELFEDESSETDSDDDFIRHDSRKRSTRPASSSSTNSSSKEIQLQVEEAVEVVEKTLMQPVNASKGVIRSSSFRVKDVEDAIKHLKNYKCQDIYNHYCAHLYSKTLYNHHVVFYSHKIGLSEVVDEWII